jgi:hypothetical protein
VTRPDTLEGVEQMKKLLVLIGGALAGLAIWRKVRSNRGEDDLWIEATSDDGVDLR